MKRVTALNRYYKITKFYGFLKKTAINGGLTIIVFLAAFVFLDYFFLDTHAILNALVTNYTPTFILSIFFVSETVLGLIPPEIFIAWSAKTANPWFFLSLLGLLSYLGGICAYGLGGLTFKIPSVRNYIENKIAIHIINLRKWGGFFVLIGALLPVPHSIVSFACGLIKYKFTHYAVWAAFRFLRFLIYGFAIFTML
ncbi:VTT domain-containing protein [Pedobacter sp. SD-b]|uniref:VTT domain-containing protein n=2 Tax=Pedobacter segetis TaxID=2793069 RepID=A0ABS1BMA1_9SPHI|nr:VTT domain-containing protein [Pedobacter segetis]